MIVKSPHESYGRGQLPAVAVSRPRHIPSPVPSPQTTQRDGSLLSWGSCRRRAASRVHVTRSVSPGVGVDGGSPVLLVDQSAPLPTVSDSLPVEIRGGGDRSVVAGAATLDGGWVTRRGHERLTACPSSAGLFSADAAGTGYRPLRLNSSRCASNQAMTSLRFQRLCLPIL